MIIKKPYGGEKKMGLGLAIVFLVITVLVMSIVAKFVPLVGSIASWVLLLYLLGLLFGLQGLTQVSDIIAKIPYLTYMLVFSLGASIGDRIGKYLPIPGLG